MRYTATNAAVETRHLRLRVLSLRNNAMLSGVRIMAAASGLPPDSPLWPPVPPERDVAFMGWDYRRLGYDTSPGEQVALRFLNQSASTLDLPLTWRLETYAGDEVARGEGRLQTGPRDPGDVPLDLPPDRPDGHYRVRFTLGDEAHEAFHFDHRVAEAHPHLGLRLAALLDTQEPEGWVRMMAGPAARFLDVRASLPADPGDIDAALVTAEALPPDAPLIPQLRSYLLQGGVVVFFGKVAPALDEMLPVDIDRDEPWLEAPQRLRPRAFWPQFDPAHGPRQHGMRAAPRPGAEVLAAWYDDAPALVAGRYGPGRVAHIGAPPGRTWQRGAGMRGADELMLRTLYHLLDRPQAVGAVTELAREVKTARAARVEELARRVGAPDLPDAQPGASEDNFGRFGWLIEEGGLVENLIPVEGRMHFAQAIDYYALDGIGSVTRASGGLTTGDPFLEDLRAYMSSGTFGNPFEAPCIDLYKWWYCFPTVLGRPAYGPDARVAVDAHYREKYRDTLNHYAHKSLVRYRREPWTKLDYTVTFIRPVHWRDGVRFLVDQNESAAVILYCLEAYARYYGD